MEVRNGRPPKYDWPEIFNGQLHVFREFPSTARNFKRQIHDAARRQGVTVRVVSRSLPAPVVYVEAVPGPQP